MKVIEIKNLFYKYGENKRNVIKNLTFDIEEGEFVAILGHNGSGKSTLAKLINGLFLPTSGEVLVCGKTTLDEKNVFEIRKNVGLVFQNPDNQTVASIVEDDIAFGPENIGVNREEIKQRIDFALTSTGIEELRTRQISKLSGGQKQRVAIAGVLAIKPKIIIMDESTAMLDPKGREEVMSVVKNLNRQGYTVIIITHYVDEAVDADRIIVLNEGEIALSGTPKQVFSQEKTLNAIGLALPRSTYIANRLKEKGLPIKDEILTREELAKELCRLLVKN